MHKPTIIKCLVNYGLNVWVKIYFGCKKRKIIRLKRKIYSYKNKDFRPK
jgi:hypothetical protein